MLIEDVEVVFEDGKLGRGKIPEIDTTTVLELELMASGGVGGGFTYTAVPAGEGRAAGDNTLFNIVLDDNKVMVNFKDRADYENPNGVRSGTGADLEARNVYEVVLRAMDGDGNTDDATLTLSVTDIGLIYNSGPNRILFEADDNTSSSIKDVKITLLVTNTVNAALTEPLHMSVDYTYTITGATYHSDGTPPQALNSSIIASDAPVRVTFFPGHVSDTQDLNGNLSKSTEYVATVPLGTNKVNWPQRPYASYEDDVDRGISSPEAHLNLTLAPSHSSPIELARFIDVSFYRVNSDVNYEIDLTLSGRGHIPMSGFDYAGDKVWPGTMDSNLSLTGTITPPKGVNRITDATALTEFFTESRGVTLVNGVFFRYTDPTGSSSGHTCEMVVSVPASSNPRVPESLIPPDETIPCSTDMYARLDVPNSRVTSSVGVIPEDWNYDWLNERLDFGGALNLSLSLSYLFKHHILELNDGTLYQGSFLSPLWEGSNPFYSARIPGSFDESVRSYHMDIPQQALQLTREGIGPFGDLKVAGKRYPPALLGGSSYTLAAVPNDPNNRSRKAVPKPEVDVSELGDSDPIVEIVVTKSMDQVSCGIAYFNFEGGGTRVPMFNTKSRYDGHSSGVDNMTLCKYGKKSDISSLGAGTHPLVVFIQPLSGHTRQIDMRAVISK